ncbi:YciI family protein [Nonomuraea terrae]|uniref:YciI family protein n=1 Tax=Nonomuraea terrae TaxID=2530383 RepID=UPI003796D40D
MPSEEALAAFAAYQKFELELIATGEFVSRENLGHPVVSTTVRKSPDGVVATDGPFAELKEVLASFAVIDLASRERAAQAAWLLAQHADRDRDFQRRCLPLLRDAVARGQAAARQLAYLVDRVRVG